MAVASIVDSVTYGLTIKFSCGGGCRRRQPNQNLRNPQEHHETGEQAVNCNGGLGGIWGCGRLRFEIVNVLL